VFIVLKLGNILRESFHGVVILEKCVFLLPFYDLPRRLGQIGMGMKGLIEPAVGETIFI